MSALNIILLELHVYTYCLFLYVVNSVCQLGALRLVGGRNNLEGRVEVCLGNRWGTICDDFWNNADANVACRQLGYAGVGML